MRDTNAVDFERLLRKLNACEAARDWARGKTFAEAWSQCERGDWMLWLAAKVDVDRKTVVLAACACARLALKYVQPGEERPLRAIETAERWARGDTTVSLGQVRDAASAASAASAAFAAVYAASPAAAYAAAYAASAAASAASSAASAAAYVAAYAAAASPAAYAAYDAAAAFDAAARKECADIVRGIIPWTPTTVAPNALVVREE